MLRGFTFGNDFNLSSIGEASFLMYCTSFNQTLIIPSSVSSIGSGFLAGCESFNRALTIPNTVVSIGAGFLILCTSYDNIIFCPGNVSRPDG
jgi:hypothetical protein